MRPAMLIKGPEKLLELLVGAETGKVIRILQICVQITVTFAIDASTKFEKERGIFDALAEWP